VAPLILLNFRKVVKKCVVRRAIRARYAVG